MATVGHICEGTLLVLLQVNCRSICNKILEFWNLIDTHNPDVIGTESWLSEEIKNAKVFRDDYILMNALLFSVILLHTCIISLLHTLLFID